MTSRPATPNDIVPGALICYGSEDGECQPLRIMCFRTGDPKLYNQTHGWVALKEDEPVDGYSTWWDIWTSVPDYHVHE